MTIFRKCLFIFLYKNVSEKLTYLRFPNKFVLTYNLRIYIYLHTGCIFYLTSFELLITWSQENGFGRIWSQWIHQSFECMTITKFFLICDNRERRSAKWNMLAVKTLYLLSYKAFQTTIYLGNYRFFRCGLWNRKCLFLTI